MSTDEGCDFMNVPADTPLTPEEAIIRRHRREKRDLQGKIQSMKKNVNKSDKKKKKELEKEIAKLEEDLEARHKLELETFCPGKIPKPLNIPEAVIEEDAGSTGGSTPGTPKISRARKRREKKEAEDKEKQKRILAESIVLLENSDMKAEDEAFVKIMKDLNLNIVDIAPDGNCLYNAVRDQLQNFGEKLETQDLRRRTANYLREHKDEFIHFMEEENTSVEGFQKYCENLENKAMWGGQLEVRILSLLLERPIKVLQVEGVPVTFGDNFNKPELTVTYHRYRYQLGEHYNSTKKSS